ncbi:MAG: EscU/YscU/HrcU family type III secretion system export apparatus switch protein [Alphaproteobacteria bacterium]|nr:EscU/YscU/HrcU family type III secretion system export apparatus switch protein [Alphaproteobacteria bacterium]
MNARPPGDKETKAVALEYARGQDPAPKVVASGKGLIAEKIIEIAQAHGVKVREDADLVEILSTLEINAFIPLEAYAAVAEILSYVYRANASYSQRQEGKHD